MSDPHQQQTPNRNDLLLIAAIRGTCTGATRSLADWLIRVLARCS